MPPDNHAALIPPPPPASCSLLSLLRLEYPAAYATTSWFLSQPVVALLRAILAAYTLAVLLAAWESAGIAAANRERIGGFGSWFWYLTNLSYAGLTVYCVAAAVHTLADVWFRRAHRQRSRTITLRECIHCDDCTEDWVPRTLRLRWLRAAHLILHITIVSTHLAIPLLYWTVLHYATVPVLMPSNASPSFLHWQNISMHGTDGIVMLIETLLLSRLPLSARHVFVASSMIILYVPYTVIVYISTGTAVYPILDWSRLGAGTVVGWYAAALVTFIVQFGVMVALAALRDRLGRWWKIKCHSVDAQEPVKEAVPMHIDKHRA